MLEKWATNPLSAWTGFVLIGLYVLLYWKEEKPSNGN